MNEFLWGALSMSCLIAGLFFVRFWRITRDRLFLFFALAFWALCLNWTLLGVLQEEDEPSHHVYWFRLLAFGLIIAGIADKNARKKAGDPERSRP